MTTRGAIVLNMGGRHCLHTAVAVASLREHFDGEIAIITEANGIGRDTAELIAADKRLDPIRVISSEELWAGKHGQSYFCKTLLPKFSPFDVTLFLDADTVVVGSIDEVWADESSGEVVITQFSDWVSTGPRMRQRIKPWADRTVKDGEVIYMPTPENIERVKVMLEHPWPAINTGVMSWSRNSEEFCQEWHRVTRMRDVFIVDETACQIIFPEFTHRVLDDRFNCSVVYPPSGKQVLDREDVRVWHGHGMKFWKRDGNGNQRPGQVIYLPHLHRFMSSNMGNIRKLRIADKFWNQLPHATRLLLETFWE